MGSGVEIAGDAQAQPIVPAQVDLRRDEALFGCAKIPEGRFGLVAQRRRAAAQSHGQIMLGAGIAGVGRRPPVRSRRKQAGDDIASAVLRTASELTSRRPKDRAKPVPVHPRSPAPWRQSAKKRRRSQPTTERPFGLYSFHRLPHPELWTIIPQLQRESVLKVCVEQRRNHDGAGACLDRGAGGWRPGPVQFMGFIVGKDSATSEKTNTFRRLKGKPRSAARHDVDDQLGVRPVRVLRTADKEFAVGDGAEPHILPAGAELAGRVAHRRRAIATAARLVKRQRPVDRLQRSIMSTAAGVATLDRPCHTLIKPRRRRAAVPIPAIV